MQAGKQAHHRGRGPWVGAWQPRLHGEHAGLGGNRNEDQACCHGHRPIACRCALQRAQVNRTGNRIHITHANNQQGGGEKVNQDEGTAGCQARPRTRHGDKAIGRQKHDLNKDEEVKEVGGEQCAAHTSDQDQGERRIVARLSLSAHNGKPVGTKRDDHRSNDHQRGEGIGRKRDTHIALVEANGMGYYPIVHGVDEQAQAGENSNARDDKHDGIAHRTPRC